MIAVVGAAGTAAGRFSRIVAAAEAAGSHVLELSRPGELARIGVVLPAGVRKGGESEPVGRAVSWGHHGTLHAAALGSGVRDLGDGGVEAHLSKDPVEGAAPFPEAARDLVLLVADSARESLWCRASAGNQRLFRAELEGGFLVSSQIRWVAEGLMDDVRLDRSYEDFLLGFGFLPDGRTPYAGVGVLPPGVAFRWPRVASTGRPTSAAESRDRAPSAGASTGAPVGARSVSSVRDRLHETFLEVLEEQAGSDRRHAVLLGGFDSALVAAGLRDLGHEVDTYTFTFGERRYEQRHAGEMARAIGATHHRVVVTPEAVGRDLACFSEVFSQPAPQPHYQIFTVHAAREVAADGHSHVFTGDGCDSVFLGYPTVSLRARLLERMEQLPPGVRAVLHSLMSSSFVEQALGHVARAGRSTLQSLELPAPARGHLPTRYLDGRALDRLRLDDPPCQEETVAAIRLRLARGREDLDPIRLAFHGNGLVGQSGSKVEGAVAVSGLPQLSPYRHPRMSSFVRSLPVELLRPRGSRAGSAGKALLLDMVRERRLLPEFVLEMPKQSPSDSPIDRWYRGPLRSLVYRLLDDLPFRYDRAYVDEILSPKWAEEVFRDHVSLGHHAYQAIGLLCSYASFTARSAEAA